MYALPTRQARKVNLKEPSVATFSLLQNPAEGSSVREKAILVAHHGEARSVVGYSERKTTPINNTFSLCVSIPNQSLEQLWHGSQLRYIPSAHDGPDLFHLWPSHERQPNGQAINHEIQKSSDQDANQMACTTFLYLDWTERSCLLLLLLWLWSVEIRGVFALSSMSASTLQPMSFPDSA